MDQEIIELFEDLLERQGFSRMYGQILALIYLREVALTQEELQKARTRARAGLIRGLDSNSGLAGELAFYEVITGDWANLFRELDKIEHVTAEDIQRVAGECFASKNRTVGVIETVPTEKE